MSWWHSQRVKNPFNSWAYIFSNSLSHTVKPNPDRLQTDQVLAIWCIKTVLPGPLSVCRRSHRNGLRLSQYQVYLRVHVPAILSWPILRNSLVCTSRSRSGVSFSSWHCSMERRRRCRPSNSGRIAMYRNMTVVMNTEHAPIERKRKECMHSLVDQSINYSINNQLIINNYLSVNIINVCLQSTKLKHSA